MKIRIKNIIFLVFVLCIVLSSLSFAENYDKKGRIVETVVKPTAESTVDPDKISDALRKKNEPSDPSKNFSKNIFSDNIYWPEEIDFTKENIADKPYTLIRHTVSIAEVANNRYEVIEDRNAGRIRLKIRETGVGEWWAQNGFYKVNGKVYYFDENGLMVLGLAKDPFDNYYYFSETTGELLEEIPSK